MGKICSISGCESPRFCKGMCKMHYQRMIRHGDPHYSKKRPPPLHSRTHGHSCGGKQTSEYIAWAGMKKRCTVPTAAHYERYGGRGITVCAEWLDSFEAFLRDMGPKPSPMHSLDRIDNDGAYEPGNCRWATKKEQARNRGVTRLVTFLGETKPLTEVAELVGIHRSLLRDRLDRGWDIERACYAPKG